MHCFYTHTLGHGSLRGIMRVGAVVQRQALIRSAPFFLLIFGLFFGSFLVKKRSKIRQRQARRQIWLAEAIFDAFESTLGSILAYGGDFGVTLGSLWGQFGGNFGYMVVTLVFGVDYA